MPSVSIRPFDPADVGAMARLYFDAARVLGQRRYSPQQVAAWAPAPATPEAVRARAGDGRATLVAVNPDGDVVGYIDLEANGHIDHLYCRPEVAGTGVAGVLLGAVVDLAKADGLSRLYVEASELARGLFERSGFVVVARRDFEVRGVAIHNYAMERRLA